MRRRFLKMVLGGILLPAASLCRSATAWAGFPLSCLRCGNQRCRKVCRLVREDRKITTVCYGVKDEEFCVPGPSCRKCRHCETVCDKCRNAEGVKTGPKNRVWSIWEPATHAKVHTKRRLMRKTVTKTVPGFKWVVEELCPKCEAELPRVDVPPGAVLPPPPLLPSK